MKCDNSLAVPYTTFSRPYLLLIMIDARLMGLLWSSITIKIGIDDLQSLQFFRAEYEDTQFHEWWLP